MTSPTRARRSSMATSGPTGTPRPAGTGRATRSARMRPSPTRATSRAGATPPARRARRSLPPPSSARRPAIATPVIPRPVRTPTPANPPKPGTPPGRQTPRTALTIQVKAPVMPGTPPPKTPTAGPPPACGSASLPGSRSSGRSSRCSPGAGTNWATPTNNPMTASAGPRGRAAREHSRAPGAIHPLAWWAWAAGAAVAMTRIGNPLVLALLTAAVIVVGFSCRSRSPWSRALEASLVLGGIVIAVRAGFYILVGLPDSTPVLIALPGVDLPNWFTNITLLGPIHFGGLVQALIEGLRLGSLIVVFGAANALANPRRALRELPGSLHHLGTAAVIAVSAVPQLLSSITRVQRAGQLRAGAAGSSGQAGRGPLRRLLRRLRALPAVLIPVLTGALDQALTLAGSMDSRGYARAHRSNRAVGVLLVFALFAAAGGTYGLLDAAAPAGLGAGLLIGGVIVAVAASILASRSVRRTRYRPEPWGWRATLIAGSAGIAGAVALLVSDPELGAWRASAPVPPLPVMGALIALAPMLAIPAVPRPVRTKVALPAAAPSSATTVTTPEIPPPGNPRGGRERERTGT